ncbi:MAG: exosortase A [Gammaproteobacteria bacterium]
MGLLLAGMIGLLLILYRDTVLYLGGLWSRFGDGPYGHGFIVLAVGLYLVYHRREKILAQAPYPSAGALLLVAACTIVWLAASLADVQVVQVVILLPLILSVIWVVTGARVTLHLLFPVMFIVFALPVWEPLLPVLREITAAGAFSLTHLFGITAYVQDYEVQLPAGWLSIEAACSGLNYLLASLTLGVFYAWLNYRNFRSRLLVIAIVAGAAVLANILRVFVIIYLAYHTDMQHPFVKDHLMLGWYLFGALVLVLLFVDHMIYRRRVVADDTTVDHVGTTSRTGCGYDLVRGSLLLVVVTALIASGPAIAWWAKHRIAATSTVALVLPPGQSGWAGPDLPNDSWMPVYHGATELRRSYHKDGIRVLLYVGYYPQQRQDSELINDLNSISDNQAWQQAGAGKQRVSSGGQRVIEAELVSAGGQRRLVWYRYRVAGHDTTSRYVAKALQVTGLLTGRRSAAIYALAADHDADIADVRRELSDFLAAMEPMLSRIADGQPSEQGWDR